MGRADLPEIQAGVVAKSRVHSRLSQTRSSQEFQDSPSNECQYQRSASSERPKRRPGPSVLLLFLYR
jgi:hypothetical protein